MFCSVHHRMHLKCFQFTWSYLSFDNVDYQTWCQGRTLLSAQTLWLLCDESQMGCLSGWLLSWWSCPCEIGRRDVCLSLTALGVSRPMATSLKERYSSEILGFRRLFVLWSWRKIADERALYWWCLTVLVWSDLIRLQHRAAWPVSPWSLLSKQLLCSRRARLAIDWTFWLIQNQQGNLITYLNFKI